MLTAVPQLWFAYVTGLSAFSDGGSPGVTGVGSLAGPGTGLSGSSPAFANLS